ncbi:MAG: hypothetical protein EPN84_11875 [Legionella sp.]|nr:MAG: hypothetical protein EPN84_11875 [Legionella sp.]
MKDGMIQLDSAAATQPRILFKPTSWLAKVDFINHLILFNNLLITILSEKEGGKTCFSTLLQNNLDQQIKSIALTLNPTCTREQLITDLNAQLHLNADAATNVAGIVTQINERKAHVLLVIDNAQYLPEAFIEEIMQGIKGQEDFGFFHVCLVSDHSIVATLNHLAVNQFNNLIHTVEIGPLNESETRTYVLQRAMNARLINRPLTDAQFKEFYQLTKGNLAKINKELEPFINNCSTPQKVKKLINLKKASMAVSAAAVAAISYMYFDSLYQDPITPRTITAVVHQRLGNLFDRTRASLAQNKPLESDIPSWLDSSKHQFVRVALPKKEYLTEDEYLPEEQMEEEINTVAVLDKVLVIPKIKPQKDIAEFERMAAADSVANAARKFAENEQKLQLAANQAKEEAKQAAVQQVSTPVQSVAKQENKEGVYTIQLAASHKAGEVEHFKNSNKLLAETKVRHFTNEKGTWYVLTLGEYTTRSQATSEVNKLPPALAKLNPWVRPINGLNKVG